MKRTSPTNCHGAGRFPRVLALSLELLKLGGKILREVATHSRIADERIDIRSHEVWGGHDRTPLRARRQVSAVRKV
jgi:hypothetical protein